MVVVVGGGVICESASTLQAAIGGSHGSALRAPSARALPSARAVSSIPPGAGLTRPAPPDRLRSSSAGRQPSPGPHSRPLPLRCLFAHARPGRWRTGTAT